MKNYVRQHCFDSENVSNFYLSPYVYIVETEDGIYVGREDDQREYFFDELVEIYVRLFHLLAEGMSENEIYEFLKKYFLEDPYEILGLLIGGGIIE